MPYGMQLVAAWPIRPEDYDFSEPIDCPSLTRAHSCEYDTVSEVALERWRVEGFSAFSDLVDKPTLAPQNLSGSGDPCQRVGRCQAARQGSDRSVIV